MLKDASISSIENKTENDNYLNTKPKIPYTITILGDTNAGKTAIFKSIKNELFPEKHYYTYGIDFYVKEFSQDKNNYKLLIIDTAGALKYQVDSTEYYFGETDAFWIVYDVSNPDYQDKKKLLKKVQQLSDFIEKMKEKSNREINKQYVRILVGNKIDLGNRCISFEVGKSVADDEKIGFFEVSAKQNKYIADWLEMTIKEINNMILENVWANNKLKNETKSLNVKEQSRCLIV